MIIDRGDFHFNTAVIQHQNVTDADVLNQLLVVDADLVLIAGFLVHGGVEDKGLAGFEGYLVVPEAGDAQLRSLQVCQYGYKPACPGGGLPHLSGPLLMLGGTAVGEVQSGDINTGVDDPGQGICRVRGWSESCNNFGAPEHLGFLEVRCQWVTESCISGPEAT